jgi:levansucrase
MPHRLTSPEITSNQASRGASFWTAAHVSAIAAAQSPIQAVIGLEQARPLVPDLNLWDIWPVQLDDGTVAEVNGGSLWVTLSAPRSPDPDSRHNVARLRLFHCREKDWTDCGNLLPDGFAPGSREWSGSTRLDPLSGGVTLWFTAAGRRGEVAADFEQRLFQATGTLQTVSGRPVIANWTGLIESVHNDGLFYADLRTNQGIAGRIKGFRDPYWFRDPATGTGYLLFTGSQSVSASRSDYDGVIGIAAAQDRQGMSRFDLLPPFIVADELANELERPHMFVQDGHYYVFWSSQRSVFAPTGPIGPSGLYGMVASSMFGPYVPLNGTGLVMANPESEPRQAYAWQVLPSLDVVSFVDYWGMQGRDIESNPALKAQQFGGTIAPMAKIALAGATSQILAGGK